MKNQLFFGVDVGGTTVKFGICTNEGKLLESWAEPTQQLKSSEELENLIKVQLEKVINKYKPEYEVYNHIGIGIPGPVHPITKKIPTLANFNWGEVSFPNNIVTNEGVYHVHLENDANLAALGEYFGGSLKPEESLFFVGLGTGVGGGFVLDGRPYSGSTGFGCEVGHMKTGRGYKYPCGCKGTDCFETVCSATGLGNLIKDANQQFGTSIESPRHLFQLYKQNNMVAKGVVKEFSDVLGAGLANIAVLFNPTKIVIGGGIRKSGELYLEQVKESFKKNTFSALRDTPIELSVTNEHAGIIGACLFGKVNNE